MTSMLRLYETLIVRIPSELTDSLLADLKAELGGRLQADKDLDGLIIDVSSLDIVDSFVAQIIRDLAMMARLMGVRTIVSGLDSATAITLVEMGLEMHGVETTLNLEAALEQVCPWIAEAASRREQADDSLLFD